MKRPLTRWSALVLSVGALTLSVVAPSSQARATLMTRTPPGVAPTRSGVPGWRAYKTVSIRGRVLILGGIDAVSANDAWIVGAEGPAGRSPVRPLIERWNGARWHQVALPAAIAARLTGPGLLDVIRASSSRDVWAFGEAGKYAHLRGTRWTVGTLPATRKRQVLIDSASVFGPRDAWVFGARLSNGYHPKIAPYAARFNGAAWHAVVIPAPGPLVVSAVSAHDMWAVADPLPPGSGIPGTPKVLHWNGATWRAEKVQPVLPRHASLSSILAESNDNVWIGGSAPDGRGGTSELALHWDGMSWTTASPPAAPTTAEYYLTSLVPDGSGGMWGVGQALPGTPRFWHYSAGAWSAPVKGSPRWFALQLAQVPGTRSIWAIAITFSPMGQILLHGPVPR